MNRVLYNSKKHKKVRILTKGYRNRSKNTYKIGIEKLEKGLAYSYRDRKNRNRLYTKLWINRINNFSAIFGINYSTFINLLKKKNIFLDKKNLSILTYAEPYSVYSIIDTINKK
jgi:large subunit ribosomal protein L20